LLKRGVFLLLKIFSRFPTITGYFGVETILPTNTFENQTEGWATDPIVSVVHHRQHTLHEPGNRGQSRMHDFFGIISKGKGARMQVCQSAAL
jgi:hypothetical protein